MSTNDRYVITFDVGTGSGRCILFDLDGNQIAVAQREWLPKSDPKYPGSQNFDTNEAWELLKECSREVLHKANITSEKVVAATSTAMREGMVLYNKNKEVIWACPNVDARATEEVVDMLAQNLAETIYNIGGDWLNIISPARFWWIKRKKPEIYEQIAHVNMLSDWVLFKLSGELVTDPSIGSSSGIFDLLSRKWSERVVEIADLPRSIYAPVYECGTQVGMVTARAAAETGLCEGTMVVTGGADTQLALVGAGAVRPKMYALCAGTFWQTAVVDSKAHYDPKYRLRTLCHAVPGQWMTEGIGFYHGFVMRWFRDGFCQEEKRLAKELNRDAYELMEELAKDIPAGSNGVMPIFSDVMNSKRWVHASPSFLGFNILAPDLTGKAACIHAIEESAAYVTRGHAEILAELVGESPQEMIMAGGSSKGFLWPQIISNVLGIPLQIPVVKESTSLGGAICALIALGEVKDWNEAVERVVHWERTIEPDNDDHKVYDEFYARWREIYPNILKISDNGLLPSLWRAPGV